MTDLASIHGDVVAQSRCEDVGHLPGSRPTSVSQLALLTSRECFPSLHQYLFCLLLAFPILPKNDGSPYCGSPMPAACLCAVSSGQQACLRRFAACRPRNVGDRSYRLQIVQQNNRGSVRVSSAGCVQDQWMCVYVVSICSVQDRCTRFRGWLCAGPGNP